MSLAFIVIITWGNLRGVRESGRIFAVPTYFFVAMMFVLLGYGMFRRASPTSRDHGHKVGMVHFGGVRRPLHGGTIFIVLHSFASGGAAVTGVEAISNGVPAFKAPEWKNARTTLMWMGSLLGIMFLGLSILASKLHTVPDPAENVTVISQIGRAVFAFGGRKSVLYFMLQIGTLLILVLAANTSFADFPRLASFHAGDRFLPRQLTRYGDRLVFSNGIIVLAFASAVLVVAADAKVDNLIGLYAIRGVHQLHAVAVGHGAPPHHAQGTGLANRALHQRHRRVPVVRRHDHHRHHQVQARRVDHRHPRAGARCLARSVEPPVRSRRARAGRRCAAPPEGTLRRHAVLAFIEHPTSRAGARHPVRANSRFRRARAIHFDPDPIRTEDLIGA